MGRPRILDKKLLEKVRQKLKKKNLREVNVVVSQRADSLGISSEAALVFIAKELEIGVSTYQRKLDFQKQSEIRDLLPMIFSKSQNKKSKNEKITHGRKDRFSTPVPSRLRLKAAIEYLLEDSQLQERCLKLLLASTHFDIPINQATLILEDRIRKKSQPINRLEGIKLVNYSFNGDLSKTILQVSSNPDEQDGITNILRGIILAFRNPTHHHIINTFSREHALKICGLVDVLLKIVDNAQKMR